jgi:Spy/CpxP family protein refolding chaperone
LNRNIWALAASFVCLSAVSATSYGAQQAKPASAPAVSVDDALKAYRADLQTNRADVIAKNLTLTAEQAAKFWPVFERYQKEQNVIMDEQLKGIQRYAESFEKLDDAAALDFINAHLERDVRMADLRRRWLGEFRKVLPARLAARAMQIDRRLSLAHQLQAVAEIPLVP